MNTSRTVKRQLSTLPGYTEALNQLLSTCGRGTGGTLNKNDVRSLGAWVPPASVERVTFALLHALALGVARQRTQIDAEWHLEQEQREKVIPLYWAKLCRDRAVGKFGPEWFMQPQCGGDPTL